MQLLDRDVDPDGLTCLKTVLPARADNEIRFAQADVEKAVRAEIFDQLDLPANPPAIRIDGNEILRPYAESQPTPGMLRQNGFKFPRKRQTPSAAVECLTGSVYFAFEQIHLRAADESSHHDVCRVMIDFRRRADLLNASSVEHNDLFSQRQRFRLVVSDIHNSGMKAASRFESGSSNRKMRGRRTIARPSATRCR